MKIILIVVIITAILIVYIQGDGNGYKRGRKEALDEVRNIHSKVDVYSVMREAGSKASSKQRSPRRRSK